MTTSREFPARDLATEVAVGALLGVGVACWVGLVAAQAGWFRLAPVLGAGAAAALAPALGARLRRDPRRVRAEPRSGAWRAVDGPLVFAAAFVLFAPAYDTSLYGSDATVYMATGAHLARHGALGVDDELIARLPDAARSAFFPFYEAPTGARQRSPAGLAFGDPSDAKAYSTFSQLPSVWLAIAFAVGGLSGVLATPPLLAAGGVASFYLLVRRLGGAPTALLAAALLATALPQVFFARIPMGENGAQFFLWSGLLALSRWGETGRGHHALAAGLGLGLAALARPEHLVFLPLAVALLWLRAPARATGLPRVTILVAALLVAHAAALIFLIVPTHYRATVMAAAGSIHGGGGRVWVLALVLALLAAAAAAARRWRGAARAVVAGSAACWALAYALADGGNPGAGLRWLPVHTSWPVLALAAIGAPLLFRRAWQDPAGRLAVVVGVIAAAHFLYAPHTLAVPTWGARRLLPAALPVACGCAAAAVVALARRGRILGTLAAMLALAANVLWLKPIAGRAFLRGSSEAAAAVAALLPPSAVTLIDPGLLAALLDVPLWLVHDRDTIQLQGIMGSVPLAVEVLGALPDRPVYLLRHGVLPPPTAPDIVFAPAGRIQRRLHVPGVGPPGRPAVAAHTLLSVEAFRMRLRDAGG